MAIQYFLFDLDGTLTDPMQGITKSVQYALRKFGIEVENRYTLIPFIGPPLRESFQKVYDFTPEQAEQAVFHYREYFNQDGILDNALYNDIPELLKALKESGAQVLLATSKPAIYAARILEHFGIADYFDLVAGAEMDGRRSKKEEVIQYALECCGHPEPSQAIMVGDRLYDVVGAHAHSLRCVGVLYGYGGRAELTEAGADFLAESVEDLQRLLLSFR